MNWQIDPTKFQTPRYPIPGVTCKRRPAKRCRREMEESEKEDEGEENGSGMSMRHFGNFRFVCEFFCEDSEGLYRKKLRVNTNM